MHRQLPIVGSTPEQGNAAIRRAWLASFTATLALIAVLALAKSAQALTIAPPPLLPTAAAATPQDDEEETEAEAEAAEDEGAYEYEDAGYEYCEEDEEGNKICEGEEDAAEAPRECLLTTVRAKVIATPGRDQVRLQVRYATTSPTSVEVDYGLHGAKGALYLGGDRKRFAAKGVLNLSRELSETQMEKVVAAKDFTVRLRALAAPGYCKPFFDYHLDVRRATPSGLSWSAPE